MYVRIYKRFWFGFFIINILFFILIYSFNNIFSIDYFHDFTLIKNKSRLPGVYKENDSDTCSFAFMKEIRGAYVFEYRKSEKFKNPFTAVYFPLEDFKIHLEDYSILKIKMSSQYGKRIPIYLSIHYPNDSLVRYVVQYIEPKDDKIHEYEFKLEDFYTPTEWFDHNHTNMTSLPKLKFEDIHTISIQSCHLLPPTQKDVFYIQSINFLKDYYWLYWVQFGFSLFAVLVFLIPKIKQRKVIVPILEKEVNTKIHFSKHDIIVNFIAQNYMNSELDLQLVFLETGFPKHEISKIIKDTFDMTFPQYVNFIRVEVAKKLLKEKGSEKIKEIAYQVGYNSPNNFNRVFKSFTQVSPQEFLILNN